MKILLVDDEHHSCQAMLWFLKHQNHDVTECASGEEALALYDAGQYPLVLSDIQMPGMSGVELAAAIKQKPNGWQTDVVLFTGHADINAVIGALRVGVYDYLKKPVNPEELASIIERVAEHQSLLRENKRLTDCFRAEVHAATEETRQELVQMKQWVAESTIGAIGLFSEGMREIAKQAQQLHEDRSIPVLLEGETGTGKEIIAKMIHYGGRFDQLSSAALVDINCAALAPTLFESELFGYEAGSFTGSMAKGAKGKFDLAFGGTLLLDEIGEIPLELQGKLLRVLQEKEFYRVGGLKKIKTDVRVVCATNVPLAKQVEAGAFRKDLYYRMNMAHIIIPPLRERKEEILPLAELFLRRFAQQKKKKFNSIGAEAAQMLQAYDWPGNVRELQNVIEYAAFAYDEQELKPQHVCSLLAQCKELPTEFSTQAAMLQMPFPDGGYSLKQYTADVIMKVLAAHDGNQSATANYLGISRRALSYRLEEMRNKKTLDAN